MDVRCQGVATSLQYRYASHKYPLTVVVLLALLRTQQNLQVKLVEEVRIYLDVL